MESQTRRASRPKTRRRGPPRGDTTSPVRKQRMRARRLAQGWSCYELWLPPADAARLSELKRPGETLSAMVGRALRHLQAQAAPVLGYEERRPALMARIWAMHADEHLSYQEIATRLNEVHEPTLSHRGRWQPGAVGRLLKAHPRDQG